MCNFDFPAFQDLPMIKDAPKGFLWGFYDTKLKKDELGALNLLTESVVNAAAKEIQTGARVQLDWTLNNLQFPNTRRKPFEHKVLDLSWSSFYALDDEININTQSGSQWDGFKHFAHQTTGCYYNGLTHEMALKSQTNGIHNWCEAGGIAGRGVLLDWLSWWEDNNPGKEPPSPVSHYEIPVQDLESVAKAQGTVFKQGDILIVRSGFVRWHNNAASSTRELATAKVGSFIGIENKIQAAEWLYNHHFAAVAGDAVAFEAWPPKDVILHEYLLSGWGTPIGEMWDLEKLSEKCKQYRRWSFFITSAPLNVPGGVGSPPNAICIF